MENHPGSVLPPTGTVTFLFTDIEGSTRLWEQRPGQMRAALALHDALLGACIAARGGHVFKTVGDAFCAAFASPVAALEAAVAVQTALPREPWPADFAPLRVRAALHSGVVQETGGDYFGPPVNRVARLLALGYGGQTLLSAPTYELVRDSLPAGVALRDLGTHRMKDLTRAERAYQVLAPGLPADFPPLKSLETLPHNLPVQLTSFVGREREIAEVESLLAGGGAGRLVTLAGSGGAGKTRLALQAGAELLDAFPDGVWLVELAPLLPTTGEATVAETIGRAVGVREEPGTPMLDTLARALREKRLLVLLDNCEHLVAVCARIADALLHACPRLHVLATSREPLGVLGETVYRVPSLSLPPPGGTAAHGAAAPGAPTPESLSPFESVRLFVERAVASRPDFAVTNANAPHVAQLCVHLDGIPLALELAAARTRSLPVEEINARLDHRFRLLTGGNRAALPRQQTLRATVDWSYALLTESERLLLCRLSVFAGRWTLESAEAVCGFDPLEDWEVVDLLSSLVEKSLAQFDAVSGRYGLLETIREYGRERLEEAGADPAALYALRCRHRDRVRALADEVWDLYLRTAWSEIHDRFGTDVDDLRAAMSFCLADTGSTKSAEVAAGTLTRARGGFVEAALMRECREWAQRVQEHPALDGAGSTAAWLSNTLAMTQNLLGNPEGALSCLDGVPESHALHGDLLGECDARFWRSWAALQTEDLETARAELRRACYLSHELGIVAWEAGHWNSLGLVAQEAGDLDEARSSFAKALRLFQASGDPTEGIVHENLAYVHILAGQTVEARASLATAHRLYFRDGPHSTEVMHHLNLCDTAGALACATGEFALAARCYATSERVRGETGLLRERYIERAVARGSAAARAALGPEAYASERARAREVPLDAFLKTLGAWLGVRDDDGLEPRGMR